MLLSDFFGFVFIGGIALVEKSLNSTTNDTAFSRSDNDFTSSLEEQLPVYCVDLSSEDQTKMTENQLTISHNDYQNGNSKEGLETSSRQPRLQFPPQPIQHAIHTVDTAAKRVKDFTVSTINWVRRGAKKRVESIIPSISIGITTTTTESYPSSELTSTRSSCLPQEIMYNNECKPVLATSACETGNWLVEDENTGQGKCVQYNCSVGKVPLQNGTCTTLGKRNHCPLGMIVQVYKSGQVDCDCEELHLFNAEDGNCYPAEEQGPCKVGEKFSWKKIRGDEYKPTCVVNQCRDKFVCNAPRCPDQRQCVRIGESCNQEQGKFRIHPQTYKLYCHKSQSSYDDMLPSHVIGNVPTLACAPGTKRDMLGTCRKPTKVVFS